MEEWYSDGISCLKKVLSVCLGEQISTFLCRIRKIVANKCKIVRSCHFYDNALLCCTIHAYKRQIIRLNLIASVVSF
ncbi:Os02g0174500 [Oryza sativa Japonica Group]|uniref:Os02g0174500 protein n=1 Tax=Oryza sativa subsp. japonica TaxID=39947 RepID=A0A0P0VFG6_ORYSJ|nr:hypothetical protein EE612_009176 [Oryza sativa]BAS77236.1 Os02g0174500 [Oryza sativa Japonica Group]